MGKLLVEIRWIINGITYVLQDYESINIRRSSDLEQNACEITLKNSSTLEPYVDNSTLQFNPDQPINVFAKIDKDGSGLDTSLTSNDLIFNGRVAKIAMKEDPSKSTIKLNCSDSSFVALNKLWVGEESGTPAELIVKVVDFVNNNVATQWDTVSAATTTNGGFIQDTDSDGNAFTSSTFSKVFKPAFEVIQELSEPEYTGDLVPYRFSLSVNNVLSWFYPDDSAEHAIHANQTTPQTTSFIHPITKEGVTVTDEQKHAVYNYDLNNSIYDVVNYIIFKCGEDMDGNQIVNYAYDKNTGAPVVKDSLRVWEDLARDMKEEDRRAGNITKTYSDEYSYPTSYPMTPAWKRSSGTVANDTDYNNEFIIEATRRARAHCAMEFKFNGSPKLKGKIELEGKSSYEPNEAVLFTAPNTGINKQYLRITDVQHNLLKNGWSTTLTVEEEVPLS